MAEVDKGWLSGPLAWDEVPDQAPISKRFGLRQRHKVRLIDDFSESAVNDTVSVHETPVLHTVDVACAATAYWFEQCEKHGVPSKLLARTFDLSSAYRQVALSQSGREHAYIRVYNPSTGKWAMFQALVLPFGAIRSVHSFLRAARAIWWLGVVGCKLFWSSFFDAYIVFTPPQLSVSAELSTVALFKLLGWIFAEDGRTCKPFQSSCEALGVVFDLSESDKGKCKVSNTASRIEELSGEIQRILEAGVITQVESQKLRGRMQFAESQIYGRTSKRCLATLRDLSCRRRSKILERDEMFLRLFISLLKSEDPRIVCCDNRSSVVILTDASYEPDSRDRICGLGGLVVDRCMGKQFFFSLVLSEQQRAILGEPNRKQIIFEAETLCAVLAYNLWMQLISDRKSFLFVDNEGTKFCLIKGSSDNIVVDTLAQIFAETETHVRTACWISRVSSYSNLADAPSRGDCTLLRKLGFVEVSEDASNCLDSICRCICEKLGKKAAVTNPT